MEYSTVDVVLNVFVLTLCGAALLNGLRAKEQHVQLTNTNLVGVLLAILVTAFFQPMLGANLALLAIVVTYRPGARERFTIERIYPQRYLRDVMRSEEEAITPAKKRVRFSDEVVVKEEFAQPKPKPVAVAVAPKPKPVAVAPKPTPKPTPKPVAPKPVAAAAAEDCYSGFDITLDMLTRAQTNTV